MHDRFGVVAAVACDLTVAARVDCGRVGGNRSDDIGGVKLGARFALEFV